MVLGADTGFPSTSSGHRFLSYANNHPRVLQIWQELVGGLHTMVVSKLTINKILVYFYQRGDGAKGQEWGDLMVETG